MNHALPWWAPKLEFPRDTIHYMNLESLRIEDFAGGMNDIDLGIKFKPNECTWDGTSNVELKGRGQVASRRGLAFFPTTGALPATTTATNRITNMKTYRYPGGPGDLLIMSNGGGGIYIMNPNAVAGTLTTVLAAGVVPEWEFIQAQDSGTTEYVWCLNGLTAPQKFNAATSVLSAWAGTPPNGTFHRVWKGMMIISGVSGQPQRIYFSTIGNPESWPVNNFIDIKSTDDETDAVTALEVIGEYLLVFKEKSVWLVFDSVSFDNRRIADVGCVGRGAVARSVNEKTERVYWVSRDGVYSTDGDEIQYESKLIERRFKDLNLTWGRTLTGFGYLTRLCMLHDGKLFLYNWLGIGWLNFNTILYLDTRFTRDDGQHPWFRHSSTMSGISAMTGVFSRLHDVNQAESNYTIGVFDLNNVAGGAQTWADVLRDDRTMDSLVTLNDTGIVGTYESGFIELYASIETMERVRRLNISGDSGSVNIRLQGDGGTITYSSPTVSLSTLSRFVRFRPEVRGRFFQILLDMVNGCRISQVELVYRGGKEH